MWHKQYLLSQPIFPNSCSKQCQIMKYLPVHANALRTPRWQHIVKERKNDNWFIQVMSWYLATVGTYTESSGNSWWRSPHAATKIICQYVIFKLLIAVKCSVHAKFLEWPIPSSLIRASMTQLRIQAKNNKINNSNIITWHKL